MVIESKEISIYILFCYKDVQYMIDKHVTLRNISRKNSERKKNDANFRRHEEEFL